MALVLKFHKTVVPSLRYIIVLFLGLAINMPVESQKSFEKLIRKAANNSYEEGVFSYKLIHTTLNSNGDTLSDIYTVRIINRKNEFSFSSTHSDSLAEVYYNNLLLRSNSNTKRYRLQYVDAEDAFFECDALYQPFLDKTFKDYFRDSVLITKQFENNSEYAFKVTFLDPGDLDELFILVTISKPTKTITEYSVNGKVGGIPIYNNYKVLYKSSKYTHADSLNISKNVFYDAIIKNSPFCANEDVNGEEKTHKENELSLEELQGVLPTLHLISTKNDTLILSELDSKYYLVDFWFRSCLPCIKAAPVLKDLHLKYDEEVLKIISINSIDKSMALIDKFLTDNELPYDVYTQSVEYGRKFESIHVYPTFFLFDRYFNLLKTIEGYSDNLMSKIESFIK